MSVKISVRFDPKQLELIKGRVNEVLTDKGTLTACHNAFYKKMDPYVPFDTGTLAQNVEVTADHVRYKQPYAHYMYEGIVYGPNIPIIQNGQIVGFFSIPGKKKIPTGQMINYDTSHHPLAGAHWDKLMMETVGDSFCAEIGRIIKARLQKKL